LIDEKFNHEHEKFVQSLIQQGSTEQQFKYLETMLTAHHQQIQSCIEDYLMQGNEKEKALTYMSLQNMHLRLLCQHYPERALERVRRIKKNEVHVNVDDCLEICQQFEMVEASAIFLYKVGNFLDAATKYITLMTDKQYYNYAPLTRQLAKITAAGQEIPHFASFPTKEERTRAKAILNAMEKSSFTWSLECGFTVEQWSSRLIVRFDYLLRKTVNASAKESTENYNEDTLHKTWFSLLDAIFKVKYSQLKILDRLREQASDSLTGTSASEYEAHSRNLEVFFKSRVAYVVERTLKHIGPEEFLDHVAANDDDIMFKELRDMILLIFSETSNEHAVLLHACRSANQHDIATFAMLGQDFSLGLRFDYRRCLICKRFVDEIQNQNKRLGLSSGRTRTFSGHHSVNSDSDDDYELKPFIDPFSDTLTLYDCGHSFHVKCVERHIRTTLAENLRRAAKGKPVSNKQVVVTQKMVDQEPCPHCHSAQFKIDFEGVFARRAQISKGVSTNRTSELGNEDAKSNDRATSNSSEDSMQFSSQTKHYHRDQRREMRATSIARHTKSVQEQKMHHFDLAFLNEGVTVDNFNQKTFTAKYS
jgi:hypothetical protein